MTTERTKGSPRRTLKKTAVELAAAQVAGTTTLFVLDTNVLMHDPTCLFRFQEHDILVPLQVLEELDKNKKGYDDANRNARESGRLIEALIGANGGEMKGGIPLFSGSSGAATGRLFVQSIELAPDIPKELDPKIADNVIVGVVKALKKVYPGRKIVLVTKDVIFRIKARGCEVITQDYRNDEVVEDTDILRTGMKELRSNFWMKHGEKITSWRQDGYTFWRLEASPRVLKTYKFNELVFTPEGAKDPFEAIVKEKAPGAVVFRSLIDYTKEQNALWGITARNREQNFALNLLMDPEIDFVTLLGQAGTGKTLITLAAALAQTLDGDRSLYGEIYFTRLTVSVGEDIGFLPGTEEEKMNPWAGALEDNMEILCPEKQTGNRGEEWRQSATRELIKSRIKVKNLGFFRGRTFHQKFVIIDEAQNLTPQKMRTLITRAGPGTKVVAMGNAAQIDVPYVSARSCGIVYAVERFDGWPYSGHCTFQKIERSRLADYAAAVLSN